MFGMKHVFANKKVNQCVKIPIDVKEYVKQLIQRECAVCVWRDLPSFFIL